MVFLGLYIGNSVNIIHSHFPVQILYAKQHYIRYSISTSIHVALSLVPPRKRRSNDESSSTELVTHKSERSPDRAVLAGDDAPSMGDFSAACNHGTGRNPRRLRTGNSEWAQVRCSLQLKPCSVFIVAAVPIPTAPSTSRTSNRGSCQTMVPLHSSHHRNPFALPVTVVPIPKAWFPPGNCTKQGPTPVPRWLSPLVVMVHYT